MRLLLFFAAGLVAVDAVAQVGPRGGLIASTSARRATEAAAPATPPHPAVCRVVVPEADGVSYGSGSLVDVRGEYGLVVTNWHVVENASAPVTVFFPDGFQSAARIVRTDETWDLAALAIWLPNCQPLPISSTPPRPGEPLWIAGYGQGSYRIAAGRCTQYVAPGPQQPYEIVELSATARQGDSGGPILNERGELAGVLFGEGGGSTAGSYCGRVATFVASVLPVAGAASDDEPAREEAADPDDECGWGAAESPAQSAIVEPAPVNDGALFSGNPLAPYRGAGNPANAYAAADVPTPAMTEVESATLPLLDTVRNALAIIGAGFILVRLLRWMSPGKKLPAEASDIR